MHCNRFGLECILHMHSESLITRGRNKMVLKFLADETLTHLFWIDSDITFTPQSVCRLLLTDRDVAAGVYPMKNIQLAGRGPAGGHDAASNSRIATPNIPFNPIGHGSRAGQRLRRRRRLRRGRGGADRLHVHQARRVPADDGEISRAELHAGRPAAIRRRICTGCSSTAWSIPIPAAICRRTTRSAAAGATSAARSGSICNASCMHLGQHNFRGDLAESLRLQGRW